MYNGPMVMATATVLHLSDVSKESLPFDAAI